MKNNFVACEMDMLKPKRMGCMEERAQNIALLLCGSKKQILLLKAYWLTIETGRKGNISFGNQEVFF